MKLTVSPGGVPTGSYIALFRSVEATTNDFGDGLKWWFEIQGGPHAGAKTGCTTANKPTLKNSCGKLVSGIVGKPLSNDMEIDLASYFGRAYLIIVTEGKSGGTYVSTVTQPPTTPTLPPSPSPAPVASPQPNPSLSPTPST